MPDTYIDVIPVGAMFADPTYQRELDHRRAERMARDWNRRLVGVLEVSDRGEDTAPRYAIINGQHRWAAARTVDADMQLAATVHTGLTPEGEAKLFFDIDAKTRQLTTWDRWHARSAAGDATVTAIERIAAECGLAVTQDPGPKNLQCCAALERIWNRSAPEVLADTLVLVLDVWPGDESAKKAVVIEGIALVLDKYALDLDSRRLADAMSDITPRQLHARARDLQDSGTKGTFPMLIARVLVTAYNRRPGRGKLSLADLR
ncbi:DUF6551 family protein [Rhodococcus sp. A5(2022)]|uniref:DUF6551 family protein n=1 Tax=Rhodococcus sp. A5(2022) TaxID=3003588 RepID=UPI0022A8B0F8|nr:DUF6551 family protein [Rhodococcus sp. A5(2022)]MCZ1075065.1 hypothetical protein [Rhodococcus sp. A5(2022)]